jgi:hypothetical protein
VGGVEFAPLGLGLGSDCDQSCALEPPYQKDPGIAEGSEPLHDGCGLSRRLEGGAMGSYLVERGVGRRTVRPIVDGLIHFEERQ